MPFLLYGAIYLTGHSNEERCLIPRPNEPSGENCVREPKERTMYASWARRRAKITVKRERYYTRGGVVAHLLEEPRHSGHVEPKCTMSLSSTVHGSWQSLCYQICDFRVRSHHYMPETMERVAWVRLYHEYQHMIGVKIAKSQYATWPYPCAQEPGFKPLLRYTVRGWPVARSMLHFVKDHSAEPNNAVVTCLGVPRKCFGQSEIGAETSLGLSIQGQ